MARGISTRIRWILGILAILAFAGAAIMYWQSTQMEQAYVFADDFPQYTLIQNSSEDFLVPITVPKNREFDTISRPESIVGKYTAYPVFANQLTQQMLLLDKLPDGQRRFEQGLLPLGTRAYPVDIPDNIAGAFKTDDLIDIMAVLDKDGEPTPDDKAVILFQKVRFLEAIKGSGGNSVNIYLVALTNEQIAAYEGWKNTDAVAYFTAAISQNANGDYEPLDEIDLYPNYQDPRVRDLFAPPTPTPQPTPAFSALEDDVTPTPVFDTSPNTAEDNSAAGEGQ